MEIRIHLVLLDCRQFKIIRQIFQTENAAVGQFRELCFTRADAGDVMDTIFRHFRV